MKKLLSVLLVITMVFSMMSSMTAFASEDVVPVAETVSEDVSAPADDPAPVEEAAPAEVPAEEPAPVEELLPVLPLLPAIGLIPEEETAPEEAPVPEIVLQEEEPAEEASAEEEAPVLDGAAWAKAGGFVDGQSYIIGVENADSTLSVLKNDGGKVVTAVIASTAEATADMVWTAKAGSGYSLENNGTYLYYKNNMANTSAKDKWSYNEDGTLTYQAGGDKYSVTFADGAFAAEKSAATPATLTIYTDGADLAIPSKWKAASGLVDTQTYIIAVENADGTLSVLKNDGGKVVTAVIDNADAADESMIWTAAAGSAFALSNDGTYLYYKNNLANTSSKDKWSYNTDGTLTYQAGGDTYAIIFADGAFGAEKSAEAPAVLTLYTDGADLGTGSEGGDSGSGGGGGSTVIYNETKDIGAHAYVALVDADGKALSLDMGWHGETVTIAGEAPNRTMEAKKGTSASVVKAEGAAGVALTLEDPPGEINYVYVDDSGALTTVKGGNAADYAGWTYADGKLAYTTAGGTTYYISDLIGKGTTTDASAAQVITLYGGAEAASGGGPGGGSEEEVDAEAPVIVKQPDLIPYVIVDSGYDAPTVTVSAQLAEGVTANSLYFQWYLDGEKVGDRAKFSVADLADGIATSSYTFEELKGKPVGVYNIYCEVSCNIKDAETGEPVSHATNSFSVSFIVTKGVLENSFMTFSDVHQTYDSIGGAINDVITVHDGFVPALIICTGDWANGHLSGGDETSDNYKSTMDDYIYRMMIQVGNIDMIFVSGNHDNGAAAADSTVSANLGAAADYDGVGMIYDDSVNNTDVGTSAANKGLKVFGINYENLEGSAGVDYANILPDLEAFLADAAADYKGELIVISAHAGLHVVNGDWSGGASYNVNNADQVVDLLNQYVEDYNMDIMFFFGHDHSKGESELLLNPGDTMSTVISYDSSTSKDVTINFSYGHAGYIGNGAGVSHGHFTLVTWDQDSIDRLLYGLEDLAYDKALSSVNQDRFAEPPAPPSGGEDHQPGGDDTKPSDKPTGDNIPDTGDDSPIVLWAVVMLACMGALVAVLPRKKHN